MNQEYHYLPVRIISLIQGYGIPFVAFLLVLILSGVSVTKFIIWYWLICCILFILEYKGTYFAIKDNKLMAWWNFKHGRDIPIEKIQELNIGTTKIVPFQPKGIKVLFENSKGKSDNLFLLFHRHNDKELFKFIVDLHSMNKEIVIDSKLREWFEKKGFDTHNVY